MPVSKEKFETSDLFICATLRTKGFKIDSTVTRGSKTYFVFLDKKKCEKLERDFKNGDIEVNAFEFVNNYNAGLNTVKH